MIYSLYQFWLPIFWMCFLVDWSKINRLSEIFHYVTAKLLYIINRASSYLEPTVSYFCMKVYCSTDYYWKKLDFLNYIKGTINYLRIIEVSSLEDQYIWVDAAYAFHNDMIRHTGGTIQLYWVTLHCKPKIQKLNTKSSTEAELHVLSEYQP